LHNFIDVGYEALIAFVATRTALTNIIVKLLINACVVYAETENNKAKWLKDLIIQR